MTGFSSSESSLYTKGPAGHMLYVPSDILLKVSLVLGQHFQHDTQIYPPLLLRHPVSAEKQSTLSFTETRDAYCILVLTVGEWVHSLKVCMVFELCDWTKWHCFSLHSDNTCCVWCIGKHASWEWDETMWNY